MINKQKTVIIIGGGYAGLLAANRIARKTNTIRVVLFNERENFIERIRLHEMVCGKNIKNIKIKNLLDFRAEFIQAKVSKINPAKQNVEYIEKFSYTQKIILKYDYLLLAIGSKNKMQSIPGLQKNSLSIATIDEAFEVRTNLAKLDNGHVIVIGAGLTGIESATEIAEKFPHLEITLISSGIIGQGYSKTGENHIKKIFKKLGISIIENATVKEVQKNMLTTMNEKIVTFDLCIWTGGFQSHSLSRDSGLEINNLGQLITNECLQSRQYPEIYAAGDCANVQLDSGINIRMGCATALPLGAHVAKNIMRDIGGQKIIPFQFAYTFKCISLGRKNGLIQFTNQDDSPTRKNLTGWLAVFFKESICKMTMVVLKLENYIGMNVYDFPKGKIRIAVRKDLQDVLKEIES